MRKSWYETTLGQIAEVQSGSGFPKKYQGEKEGDYPFVKVGDMNLPENQREIVTANNWVRESVRNELRAKVYVTGSIIFPKIGAAIATNKKRLVKLPCCADNNVIGLIPNTNKVLPEFLYYWMLQHDLSEFANDSNPPSMRKSTIEEFGLVITDDLDEQKRIVAILDEAFAGIDTAMANTEKNLANARELFESYLNSVFAKLSDGCKKKTLGDVCDLQNGFAFKSKSYVDNSNTLNIRMSNIRPNGNFDPEHNIKFLPDSFAEEYSQFLLKEGDLIIAMTDMAGDPKILGLPTLVKNIKGRNFLLNQRVGKLKDFSDEIHVPYLSLFLSSPQIKNYYKSKGAGGLQINISKKDILTADIPIPSIDEQKRIVSLIDDLRIEVGRIELIYQQKLSALTELKQSLLQKAFCGELTAEDIKPGDEAVA